MNVQPMANSNLINHLIQNNTTQQITTQISQFESRVYKYLMKGLSQINPEQLKQIDSCLPETISLPERIQILNFVPLSLPELYSCIFNASEKFTQEQLENILIDICSVLGVSQE
ncbi:putative RNA polymerase Rpb4 protein [Spironucleus salmonicida]|uniref:RNA polymerase Rpb4 protein n=1 Tax=Spironucleus salmonicida TaxID=348837 RepID=V6LN40_9EUKA|nr:putative RNA polymerase Rpb4 protein [Spironucleus salmonicida]|eukprot:EST45638.1 Putative RNA polymerase Rpb4 protein [Spironucleus salmonicida]